MARSSAASNTFGGGSLPQFSRSTAPDPASWIGRQFVIVEPNGDRAVYFSTGITLVAVTTPSGGSGSGGGSSLPVNTGLPAITGTPTQGQTLTSTNGTWSNTPTGYARQWRRGGVAIAGATGTTYLLASADVGAVITVAVTATNSGGSSSPAVSAGTASIAAAGGAAAADTRPRVAIGGPAATLASLFASATVMAGATNNSTVTGPWGVAAGAGQYAYAFFPQSAYNVRPGVLFNDGTGTGGWSGAGLSGDNNGASPGTSLSSVTYSDGTTTWVVLRIDTAQTTATFTTT